MIAEQIEKLADKLIEKGISKSEDRAFLIYGLCTGMELFFNILTTIILGLLFGMICEGLGFLIAFSLIRVYAGGYHCEKAISCYFLSSVILILVLFTIKCTPENAMFAVGMILMFFSVLVLIRLAPIGTESKPIDAEESLYYRKKMMEHLAIETVFTCLLFTVGWRIGAYTLSISILVAAVLVVVKKLSNMKWKLFI